MEFTNKIISLVNDATEFKREHAPHQYIRYLVTSRGVSFYLYQPYAGDKTLVKDHNLNTLGYISEELYWILTRQLVDQAKSKSLKTLMGA